MSQNNDDRGLPLRGLDGGNPLGFLAAVGTLTLLDARTNDGKHIVRMRWEETAQGWRPSLQGFDGSESDLCDVLEKLLKDAPIASLEVGGLAEDKKISNKFPFAAARFRDALVERAGNQRARHEADLLAGLGSDLYPDPKSGDFQCTAFKMVRSGDSSGQGLLHYAKVNQEGCDRLALERTLFRPWDYRDERYSLRWDPIENQSYALRWRNPSTSPLGTMAGANSLAFEALRCLPCALVEGKVQTTGFQDINGRKCFAWPIWTTWVTAVTMRSLLALGEIRRTPLDRRALVARGIREVFSAEVIRPNQYYSNFAPAQPLD